MSPAREMDVVLVSMPFAEVQRPSIALGLLRAALADTQIRCEVVYGNFTFAETIGLVAYQAMQSAPTDHLLGEWCFSEGLVPDSRPDDEEYLDLVLDVRSTGFPPELDQRKDLMRWVRAQTAAYVDGLARSIVARGPRIVGCSSVFQQHCASLALLRRIHELSPDIVTMMGGANCEGEMGMETLRAFPWLDCVVSGEADAFFPNLCELLIEQGGQPDPANVPSSVFTRAHIRPSLLAVSGNGADPPRGVFRDLDALPTPNYSDYFHALSSSTLSDLIKPGLLAESSRGCWWGERSHCTFCGLNGSGMTYRSKSAPRVLRELSELSERYGLRNIQFVDNILDMSHIKTVLPELAANEEKYALFYETKANLKRDQVRLLAEAGVHWIQPGIESLHDEVLSLIGKGNSALMNLQLLKWSSEFGIHASWNMLSGVPGESDEWHGEVAEWLPAVFHLQPPSGVVRVRYDRFSPYHMRPGDYGLELTPSRAYSYVYPLPNESLMRLAYSFEDERQPKHVHRSMQDQPGQMRLQAAVAEWNDLWRSSPPVLEVQDTGAGLSVSDTRPGSLARQYTLGEVEASVYRLCDSAQALATLRKSLGPLDEAVEMLCRARLLLRLNGKLLALGVPSRPAPQLA